MSHLTRGWLRYGVVVGLTLTTLLCSPYGTAQRPAEVDLQALPADVAQLADAPAFDLQTVGLDLRRAAQTTPILRQFQRELVRNRSNDTRQLSGHLAGLKLLSPADTALYRQAFAAAAQADKTRLDLALRQVRDKLLVPHVEAAYWLNPAVSSDSAALADWLRQNRTLPVALRVYARAQAAHPAATLPKPQCPPALRGDLDENGRALGTSPPALGADLEAHAAASSLAQAYFSGNTSAVQAMDAALVAAAPLASWIAGLQAWRSGNAAVAAAAFAKVAATTELAGADRAAAYFWRARAEQTLGNKAEALAAWRQAAAFPRSFYGQLAQARLGAKSAYRWTVPQLTRQGVAAIAATVNGKRGLALLEVGANVLAEQELRRVAPRPETAMALAALSQQAQMPMLSLQLGSRVKHSDGRLLDSALYPLPPWQATASTDAALVYAVMRHESGFDPATVSKAGARGLMQLMPDTARYIAPDLDLGKIADPDTNVTLGGRYLDYLATQSKIADNLVLQVAAYNGGPGALQRWHAASDATDDPLLFIETLPVRETRHYVQNVLASYWSYQARLGIRPTSLQQLAQGQWPKRAVPALSQSLKTTPKPLRLASN